VRDVIRITLSTGERRHLDTGTEGRREPGMVTKRLSNGHLLHTLEGTIVNVDEIVEAELIFEYDRPIERRTGAEWL
jgi:hypothetical protein